MHLWAKRIINSFISAFITVIVYNFFIKRNITIKMPKEVPPNISRYLKISSSVVSGYYHYLCIRFIIKNIYSYKCSERRIKIFEPLFTAADGWIGVTLIFGAFAFFWFVGIHGPSIVEPAIAAIIMQILKQT